MENCIFCKIIKGELPSHKVDENENFYALLDINPVSVGHTLIIPKTHYRWVWDVPNIGEYFEFARKIARAQQKAFNEEAIWIGVKGEEVPHSHVSVLPQSDLKGDKKDFVGNLEKIKAAL
jgi:histidine triad (HIT) family protein